MLNSMLNAIRRNIWLREKAIRFIDRKKIFVIHNRDPQRLATLEEISRVCQIQTDRRILQTNYQSFLLYRVVQETAKIPGNIAEVGVYRGGSAKLISHAKGDRSLHLFDTFEGLPEIRPEDPSRFYEGQYKSDLEEVKAYLSAAPNVYFHKGVFPATSGPIEHEQFSMVHLDVDLYESTVACLDFFYPRMSRGGVMLSQDYGAVGARKAIDAFFADKPEPVIELLGKQAVIVKL